MSVLTLLILASVLAAGCGDGPGDPTGASCPTGSALTYENFGKPFVQQYCLACHDAGGPEGPTLASIEQIRAAKGDIDRSAAAGPNAVNTFMPEGGSVPEAERRKLGEWLACGAPE